MRQTKHLHQRMSQRGVTGSMIDLVVKYGTTKQDKYVLGRNDALYWLESLRREERILMKILDKGGITVVSEGNALITTYNLEERCR